MPQKSGTRLHVFCAVRIVALKFVLMDDITRVRGNKAHVASAGYTCEKGLRINHYQNNTSRLTSPLKRIDDGSYLEATGIRPLQKYQLASNKLMKSMVLGKSSITAVGDKVIISEELTQQQLDKHMTTRKSNALAQEKTGEAWVEGQMFGTHTHAEVFHDAEVAIFWERILGILMGLIKRDAS